MTAKVAPLLVFGWGNPGRGDDALGPLLVEQLAGLVQKSSDRLECLTDFQLQVEHALDLQDRERILFVDASLDVGSENDAPFRHRRLFPARDATFSTHAMTPEAVMQVFLDLHDEDPPPCELLAIRGERFELGEPLTPSAAAHLDAALHWARTWMMR